MKCIVIFLLVFYKQMHVNMHVCIGAKSYLHECIITEVGQSSNHTTKSVIVDINNMDIY